VYQKTQTISNQAKTHNSQNVSSHINKVQHKHNTTKEQQKDLLLYHPECLVEEYRTLKQ